MGSYYTSGSFHSKMQIPTDQRYRGGLNIVPMLIWIVAYTSGFQSLVLRAPRAFKLLLGVSDPHCSLSTVNSLKKKSKHNYYDMEPVGCQRGSQHFLT